MRSQNINSAQIIEINTVEDETLLIARLISAVKLSFEQAFLSDLDSPNMKQQIDAVIRGTLPQYYHLRHWHHIGDWKRDCKMHS